MASEPESVAPRLGSKARVAWGLAFAIALAVIAVDQITKHVAMSALRTGESTKLAFGIEISNVHNKGVAFGLLSGGDAAILVFTLGALTALFTYFAFNATRPMLWLAVGFLSGGAVANLVDRLRTGAVTDFIDFPLWPAFNLADVSIVIGACALALILISPRLEHGPH